MMKSRWFERGRSGHTCRAGLVVTVAMCASLLSSPTTAAAQASSNPNSGALTFTGGFDVASGYVFRGLVQEAAPKITVFPYGDIGIALTSGQGAIKSSAVNVGLWNSLNTGSSGTDGPSRHAHYEEDFSTRLNVLFGGGIAIGAGYMARTSPNNMFNTAKEFQVKVVKLDRLSPYGFLASELTTDGQADGGTSKGTYLELGVGPSFAIGSGRTRITVPTRVGLSVKDYYERSGADHKFGFFAVGGIVTLPLGKLPDRFGSWSIHGGADAFMLGETLKLVNGGDRAKVVGLIGVGVTY